MEILMNKSDITEAMPQSKKNMIIIDEINGLMPGTHVMSTTNIPDESQSVANAEENEPENLSVFPSFMLVEIMFQTAMIGVMSMQEFKGRECYIAEMGHTKFKSLVKSGDALVMDIKILRIRGNIVICKCFAKVANKKVFLSDLTFIVSEEIQM